MADLQVVIDVADAEDAGGNVLGEMLLIAIVDDTAQRRDPVLDRDFDVRRIDERVPR